jgi:GGDEF domain-containing protein
MFTDSPLVFGQSLRRSLEVFRRATPTVAGRAFGATASFGIAGFRGSKPSDLNVLVAHADTALYAAKHKGRDRIEFANQF